MKKLIIFLFLLPFVSFGEAKDTLKTYKTSEVEIISRREIQFVKLQDYGPGYSSELLNRNGYQLIRRGLSFTQDIYSDGFKKGDIRVVIDGEYYHNACPNRMDAPATRVNPVDLSEVEITKSTSLLSTGLYGKVEYHRTKLEKPFRFNSFVSGQVGANSEYDVSFSAQSHWTSISARFSQGIPYKNAKGNSFSDLYMYKDNYKFSFGNIGFRKLLPELNLEAGFNFSYAKDISFPYLMMDERSSKVFSGYLQFKGYKAYLNYTDHLMNDGLRENAMGMETRAKNITTGIKGDFFEFVYRNWNADNVIMQISNKMLPNVDQFALNLASDYSLGFVKLFFKGGVNYLRYKDESRKAFFESLYPDAKTGRIFISGGLSAIIGHQFSEKLLWSVLPEIATDAPEPEMLFLALVRPMNKPDWSGNPTLKQPIRATLRTSLQTDFLTLELFGNYVLNYVDIVVKKKEMKNAMTYDNVNAIIAGANLKFNYKWLTTELSYLWGENEDNKKPLAEIAPLSISSKVEIPIVENLSVSLTHRWENAQKRVNPDLKEFSTPAWNTLGLGLQYSFSWLHFDLQIQNLLNHNYYRFLSFSRNPFSAGMPVYEPGRVFMLTVYFNKN